MTLGKLRSIEKAFGYFQVHAPPVVTDRRMEDYDVLIYPVAEGADSGKYFVGLVHHRALIIRNTRAGCVDSSGGYSGGFIVDPVKHAIIQQSCK